MNTNPTSLLLSLRDPLIDAENTKRQREALISTANYLVGLAAQNPTKSKKILVFGPTLDLITAMEKFGDKKGVYRVNGYAIVIKTGENPVVAIIPRTERNSEWAQPFLRHVNFENELPAEELSPEGVLSEQAA